MIALTHYIDDSGCHEESATSIAGGPVFLTKDSHSFHYEWWRLAETHKVPLPIHMRDFARSHGRLAHVEEERRRALFRDLVTLINKEKAWTLTVHIANDEFRRSFDPKTFRNHITPDSMAFFWCMLLNHLIVKHYRKLGAMSYVVATSSRNAQLRDSYAFWKSYEGRVDNHFTGTLTFDTPTNEHALQAADLVAWANRRKRARLPFNYGFEPLELLTRTVKANGKPIIHFDYPAKSTTIAKLASIIGTPARGKGSRQSLLGLIPPAWITFDQD